MKTVIGLLEDQANLSLEGDLSSLEKINIEVSTDKETPVLKRQTIWPKFDFAIIEINENNKERIINHLFPQIGLKNKVFHVQIEKDGELILGAYDNFHPECVWIGDWISEEELQSFVNTSVIGPFTKTD